MLRFVRSIWTAARHEWWSIASGCSSDNLLQLQGQLIDATSKRDRLTKELAATPATIVVETDPWPATRWGVRW